MRRSLRRFALRNVRAKVFRLQFSMRTLLLLMAVCAFGLSWLVMPLYEAYRERSAVEVIKRVGGSIQYATDRTEDTSTVVRLWFGENPPVVGVSIKGSWPDSEHTVVQALGRLRRLKTLSMVLTSDDSLATIGTLPQLESLDLEGSPFTGLGFKAFETRGRLKNLSLAKADIADDCLRYIAQFSSLESLNLDGTRIDGTGLPELKSLTNLTSLSLSGTLIRDHTVRNLPALQTQEALYLNDLALTDPAIGRLPNLPKLRVLEIGRDPWLPETVALMRRRWPQVFSQLDALAAAMDLDP